MLFPNIKSKVTFVFSVISSALVVFSIVLIVYLFPNIIEKELYKSVKLKRGTEQYDRFLDLPFPVTFKVYFFDVQNVEDILNGKKPVVREVGPYVYKQYRKKAVKTTDNEEDTISYTEQEFFEFDKEASGNLSDNDVVTTLNSVLVGVLEIANNFGLDGLLSNCLKDIFPQSDTVFIQVKVKDILFEGLHFCFPHLSFCELQRNTVCKIIEEKKYIDKLSDGSLQFSYINYKNKSNDLIYTVNRGIRDVHLLGKIIRLNNSTHTNFWNSLGPNSVCDEVNGTYTSLFPPQISKNSTFRIFSPDICRSFTIKYIKEESYKGINGYMFATDNSTFRSSSAEKDCFCSKQTQNTVGQESCYLDGVVDLQPCTGAPTLLSFPHFLFADKAYLNNIDGLTPNEESHNSFLLLEPETGTPLRANSKVQMNAVLRPISKIKQMKNLPPVVLPLIWMEEEISLTDEYVEELQEAYFDKVYIVNIVQWALLGGSLALTVIFGSCFLYKRYINKLTTS